MIGLFLESVSILALLVPLCERACVFRFLFTNTRASAGLRTSSLARRPSTDLTRAPSSWGQVVRLFRSWPSDHPTVRIPGVILEAVTTALYSPHTPPPFVILHLALL